jgi:hypothetical protein
MIRGSIDDDTDGDECVLWYCDTEYQMIRYDGYESWYPFMNMMMNNRRWMI